MSDAVRDLTLLPEATQQAAQDSLRKALQAWAEEWLPDAEGWTPAIEARPAATAGAPDTWTAASTQAGHAAWSAQDSSAAIRLASLLNGKEGGQPLSDTDWAVDAAGKAIADLNTRVLGTARQAEDKTSPDLQALSGTLVLHAPQLGLYWAWSAAALLALHPQQTKATTNTAPKLALILDVIQAQPLCLHANLGQVEISVADLVALRPGDVVRFPAAIDQGIHLSIEAAGETKDAAIAHLGQQDGHTTVRLHSPI